MGWRSTVFRVRKSRNEFWHWHWEGKTRCKFFTCQFFSNIWLKFPCNKDDKMALVDDAEMVPVSFLRIETSGTSLCAPGRCSSVEKRAQPLTSSSWSCLSSVLCLLASLSEETLIISCSLNWLPFKDLQDTSHHDLHLCFPKLLSELQASQIIYHHTDVCFHFVL